MASAQGQETSQKPEYGVLHPSCGGGPMGLGDPDSTYLRKVEIDIVIPAKMREKAKKLCEPQMKAFGDCAREAGLGIAFRCRGVGEDMRQCLQGWYDNEAFQKECREEYLKERAEYRRTGITKKMKAREAAKQAEISNV